MSLNTQEILRKLSAKVSILWTVGIFNSEKVQDMQKIIIMLTVKTYNESLVEDKKIYSMISETDNMLDTTINMVKASFVGNPIHTLMDNLVDHEKSVNDCVGACVQEFSAEEYKNMVDMCGPAVLRTVGLKGDSEHLI